MTPERIIKLRMLTEGHCSPGAESCDMPFEFGCVEILELLDEVVRLQAQLHNIAKDIGEEGTAHVHSAVRVRIGRDRARLRALESEKQRLFEGLQRTAIENLKQLARLQAADKLADIADEVPGGAGDDGWIDRVIIAAAAYREAK